MPDKPDSNKRRHPVRRLHRATTNTVLRPTGPTIPGQYAELQCKSNFSLLCGASHPEELIEQAAKLGYSALAITDHNTLAGVVRMHCAAKACKLKLIVGAEITPVDAAPILLYATDRASYGRLARIITQGRLRVVKGSCAITLDDIAQWSQGLIAAIVGNRLCTDARPNPTHCRLPIANCHVGGVRILHNSQSPIADRHSLHTYRDIFPDRLYLAASVHGGADDARHLAEMDVMARKLGVSLLATNDVHYHEPRRRFLQDVLTCIRRGCTLQEAGNTLFANAERHLKPIHEMERLFRDYADAIARTIELRDRCSFSLDELRYEYPEALSLHGRSPRDYLAELTWAGAHDRYPNGIPHKVRSLLKHELVLIAELAYEPYFLTVWDIVQFARSRDILCQGRGSAANSAVCYCLGITSVDPDRVEMLFERFVSAERNEPPDIDVDFEHERREEVFQYIYDKYGRDHAGIVAEVITYRPRSAIRDVGKALGLSLDRVAALAKKHEWWDKRALPPEFLDEVGLDPSDRTVRLFSRLVPHIIGFPRHLSQHVGGFVITRGPLCEMVPIENGAMSGRTFIEWDKDDIDALGILKIDCLALGMLTAIHRCFTLLSGWYEREGRRDEGTKGRRDQEKSGVQGAGWTAELGCDIVYPGDQHGECENLSRSHRVAEGHRVGQSRLPGDTGHAGDGTVRADCPNAPGSGLRPVEHCRRERASHTQGLHSFPLGGAGIAGGTGNPNHDRPRAEHAEQSASSCRSPFGDRPTSPGADSQSPGKTQAFHSIVTDGVPPSSLRPFVPSSLSEVPAEDPVVYDMICRADTVGVFQIESRAQMSMLPRLKPRGYYDLVIEVAIVRPGPIQGGMVHPYLRRRSGEEAITYPSEAIRDVLERTLGVPLFQEQAMRLAIVAAGFTPGEADRLRRAMGAWRHNGDIANFRTKLIEGMTGNGLSKEFAERCFEQICGFGEYGFPESHAASFALLVYVSAWLKRYHPAAFCAALVNSQPMGFYQPAQLVRDAIQHGVPVYPVDVNYSGYDCRLSIADCQFRTDAVIDNRQSAIGDPGHWGVGGPAVRLGMRLVKGISRAQVEGIESAQRDGPFRSVTDLARRSGASRATLARLAAADALRSLGLNRREAVWQVLALSDEPPLLHGLEPAEPAPDLPELSMRDVVLADYDTIGLSLNAHPMSLIREDLNRLGVHPNCVLQRSPKGRRLQVSGIVLVRQRPSTANGIVFCTLEDETGNANLIIRPAVYEKYRRVARGAAALIAEGRVERQGEVVHLQVECLLDASEGLAELQGRSRDFH
jgi:error-prone DNA polymerase